jgi:hypothetical protein
MWAVAKPQFFVRQRKRPGREPVIFSTSERLADKRRRPK